MLAHPISSPFGESKSSKTNLKGIFYESLDAILKKSKSPYEIVIHPFPRLNREVSNGDVDFSFGFKGADTTTLVQIGCHYNILVTHNNIKVKSEEDINGLIVGFVAKGVYQRIYGEKFNTKNEYVADDESLFKMLLAERIDGFFISNVVLESYLKFGIPQAQLPTDWKEQLAEPYYLAASPTFLQISNKSDLPFSEVNRITVLAEKLRDQQLIPDIYRKYGVHSGGKCVRDLN